MKAYVRFRVPPTLAESLSKIVDRTFPFPGLIETKSPNDYHVTLAYFGDIHPAATPVLMDSIGHAYIRYGKIRPIIKLERFAIFGTKERRLLVALASVTPHMEWNRCRDELLRFMGIDPGQTGYPVWNPHITLGELGKRTPVPSQIGDTFMWEPPKVELVLKTKVTPLILPAWQFE